jgi:regulator of PEP synthase PpsR (kinase-PPPase family)
MNDIQSQQYLTIERLKSSLAKSEKRAHVYSEKFHKLKNKIYTRCKRLNDEVSRVRKLFERKMAEFFTNYTRMIKEIIFTNNKVSSPY